MLGLFQKLRQKRRDMRTLCQLLAAAEQQARRRGQDKPGAEHLLLAALDHPDGHAKQAFASLGVTFEDMDRAIDRQYQSALEQVGLDGRSFSLTAAEEPLQSPVPPIFDAQPSAQDAIQRLYNLGKASQQPLTSAHLAKAIAAMENGTAARTLDALEIGRGQIATALDAELEK